MKRPRTRPSLLFRLIVPVTVVFILTVLSLISTLFGDPAAPVAQWLDANGDALLFWEFIAILVIAILAMTVDRIRTLKGLDEELLPDTDAEPEVQPEPTSTEIKST